MNSPFATAAIAGTLSALVGCSGGTERAPGMGGGGTPVPNLATDEYPEGPYGRENPSVGETIEDLHFYGYRGSGEPIDARDTPEEFSFSELREEGRLYLLIHVSAFWCATCQPEAFYMSQYTGPIRAAGGEVLEILVDGDAVGDDPTEEQLDVWVLSNDLKMNTVIPGDDKVREVFPDRDFVYIVDLESMQVVWQQEGPSTDPATTEIGALEMLEVWLAE